MVVVVVVVVFVFVVVVVVVLVLVLVFVVPIIGRTHATSAYSFARIVGMLRSYVSAITGIIIYRCRDRPCRRAVWRI